MHGGALPRCVKHKWLTASVVSLNVTGPRLSSVRGGYEAPQAHVAAKRGVLVSSPKHVAWLWHQRSGQRRAAPGQAPTSPSARMQAVEIFNWLNWVSILTQICRLDVWDSQLTICNCCNMRAGAPAALKCRHGGQTLHCACNKQRDTCLYLNLLGARTVLTVPYSSNTICQPGRFVIRQLSQLHKKPPPTLHVRQCTLPSAM